MCLIRTILTTPKVLKSTYNSKLSLRSAKLSINEHISEKEGLYKLNNGNKSKFSRTEVYDSEGYQATCLV